MTGGGEERIGVRKSTQVAVSRTVGGWTWIEVFASEAGNAGQLRIFEAVAVAGQLPFHGVMECAGADFDDVTEVGVGADVVEDVAFQGKGAGCVAGFRILGDGVAVFVALVDVHTFDEAGEDRVGVDTAGVFTELQGLAVGVAGVGTGTDEGGVVNYGLGVRSGLDVAGWTAVHFRSTVGGDGILDGEPELAFSAEAFIPVEGVILVECTDQVLGVDRAAEELKAVVRIGKHFNVLDGRAGTDTAHGQTIDFVVGGNRCTAMADGDIFKYTGTVGVIITAIFTVSGGRKTFDELGTGIRVDAGRTKDDHTAPEAGVRFGQAAVVGSGGEDDRIFGGTSGHDIRTAGDDQGSGIEGSGGFRLTFDNCTRINRQGRIVFYINDIC